MKKLHVKKLNSIKYHVSEYGYIPLSQYKEYYHLKSLRKIIKLKNENRILCTKRSNLKCEIFEKSQSNGWFIAISLLVNDVAELSEKIGKNSHKIRKLRASYCKYSQKWIDSKLTNQTPKDIPY